MIKLNYSFPCICRRRVRQALESAITRHTHCAVVVEAAAIIYRRKHVHDVVTHQSAYANVSSDERIAA
jgi:hypothetical protein